MLQAFQSRRIVTPEGIRPAAILVQGETIEAVVAPNLIPQGAELHDFGDAAILPGLVDSHVHINDPGRADWEGFETATCAAAAGGYTFLVDMPLNCLPATTTVAALEAKRAAAQGRCRVDWAAWGGVVHDNQGDIESLAAAGVLGFKCFLVHPGIDGFTMVTEQQLRAALPAVARTGLPLLVHAELPGPIDEATETLAHADWRKYSTYLQSRPEEAELTAIRMLLSLCREYGFRLHIVHLSASSALPELRAARSQGLQVSVETCPHYLHVTAEEIEDGATLYKCAPPIRGQENREKLWQALKDGVIDLVVTDHSPCPPSLKRLDKGSFKNAWGGISSLSVALPLMWTDASFARIYAMRYCALDVRGAVQACRMPKAEGKYRAGIRCRLCHLRSRGRICRDRRPLVLPSSCFSISWGKSSRRGESDLRSGPTSIRRWQIYRDACGAGSAAPLREK